MSFDYKQIPSSRPDFSANFLIGLFFGFLLGLGVAAGIAIYFFKTPIPFADRPGAPKDSYFLQAGSFQNPADADNLKARLALMGLEASVEPANLAEKGVWYRVRLGPYTRVDEINRVRQQLTQNGVDASLVKITDVAKN